MSSTAIDTCCPGRSCGGGNRGARHRSGNRPCPARCGSNFNSFSHNYTSTLGVFDSRTGVADQDIKWFRSGFASAECYDVAVDHIWEAVAVTYHSIRATGRTIDAHLNVYKSACRTMETDGSSECDGHSGEDAL